MLDVDVKPNRGDALSMVGLAREIAAFTGAELRLPDAAVVEADDDASAHVSVRIEEPELNPRFTARWFGGVTNGESPDWMQRRLIAAGMRPISAVVDVTNYVMHELGQPMHAYDADAIPDGRIVVRRARDGETARDDRSRRSGRSTTGCWSSPTRSARSDWPASWAAPRPRSAPTRAVSSSSRRSSTGRPFATPPDGSGCGRRRACGTRRGSGHDLPPFALDRAAHLIAEITGARVARGIVDNDPEPKPRRRVAISVDRISRLLGLDLAAARVTELLRPLEFEVDGDGDALEVSVPPHRLDVTSDADVAEEVARAHGYERIPWRLPRVSLPPYRPDPSEPRHRVRRILAGLGLDEMVSHALIGRADLDRTRQPADGPELIHIFNPLSEEHAILRPTLYPSLLAGVAENARWRQPDVRLFDVGKVYWYNPGTGDAARSARRDRRNRPLRVVGARDHPGR